MIIRDATTNEIVELNKTWVITDLPFDKILIGCKWIYKIRCKADGSIRSLKARLVAKVIIKEAGIDYHDSSPLVKIISVTSVIVSASINALAFLSNEYAQFFLERRL